MKRSDLPSLDDLRAFETVARIGSVRGAADELVLTHGAVSRRVSKLAKDLDIELVRSDGRGIALTQEGAQLARGAHQAFEILSATLTEIRDKKTNQPIVLSCERSVAMSWLIPRLSHFQDAFPEVPVHLSVGGGYLDFKKENVILAIRRLDFPIEPDWGVDTILEERMGPVMPASMVSNFEGGNYIGLATKTRPEAWPLWLSQNPEITPPQEIRYFDHHFLMVEGAASGLGVGMCPEIIACDNLVKDRLVAPKGFIPDGSHYGLLYPKDIKATAAVKELKDWIFETINMLKM